MPDAPSPPEPGSPDGRPASAALSAEAVDGILGDFRAWLGQVAAEADRPPASQPVETVDLFTLVSQFTALRHEVNMQTKAARAAVESNAETLKQLAASVPTSTPAPPAEEELRPLIKAVLDVADALTLAHAQVNRLGETIEPLLVDLVDELPPIPQTQIPAPSHGFLGKLLRSISGSDADQTNHQQTLDHLAIADRERAEKAERAVAKISQLITAASDGYAMSGRRIERLLPTFGLERIPCIGNSFDPDEMEAVEVVDRAETPSGEVVDEVRAGYRWRGRVFRYAQVRVAR